MIGGDSGNLAAPLNSMKIPAAPAARPGKSVPSGPEYLSETDHTDPLVYVRYYHENRTHLALAKGTPAGREAENNTGIVRKVVSMPRLGGLHHRYDLVA